MKVAQVNPRFILLSKLTGRIKRGQQNYSGNQRTKIYPGFLPVELTGLPETTKEQIEVIYPDGVRLILRGVQNMSLIDSILKSR